MTNTMQDVKQAVSLKDYADQHLQRMGKFYICPACGSGTGPNHSPAFSVTGDMWKCFSCTAHGDIYDLAGILNHTDDKRQQLEAVASWAGIAQGSPQQATTHTYTNQANTSPQATPQTPTRQAVNDYSTGRKEARQYLADCRAAFTQYIEALDYWTGRGFTIQEGEIFSIGYDPNSRRLVIPWQGSDFYYCSRDITGQAIDGKYQKPKSDKVGPQPLYNPQALKQSVVYVVEGAIDALAVKACGYEVICLGSNNATESNRQELVNKYLQYHSKAVTVLLLDNDDAGTKGRDGLYKSLTEAGIPCVYDASEAPYDGTGYKDAGEYLQHDRDGLNRYLERLYGLAIAQAEKLKEQAFQAVREKFNILDPADVAADIYTLINAREPIPTGIAGLDHALNGGIRPGLIILGAISSLGKTTLCLQIADYLAEAGHTCMFVTIEQSAQELVSKSISRIMRTHFNTTVSAQRLTDPKQRGAIDAEKLDQALTYYAEHIAPHLHILEGTEQPNVADIKAAADAIRLHTGTQPVVFIDYLQLLRPLDDRMTDKQATDGNVRELRHLARDTSTPVIAISSLNRSSYSEGVSLESFKESGAIEYGSDLLLGLQPQGMADALDDTKSTEQRRTANKVLREHKQADERACELVILKNRTGRTGDVIPLTFKAVSAYFEAGKVQSKGRAIGWDEDYQAGADTKSKQPTAQAVRKARIQEAYNACTEAQEKPTPEAVHRRYVLLCEAAGVDGCSLSVFTRWVQQAGGYGWTTTKDAEGTTVMTRLTAPATPADANHELEQDPTTQARFIKLIG